MLRLWRFSSSMWLESTSRPGAVRKLTSTDGRHVNCFSNRAIYFPLNFIDAIAVNQLRQREYAVRVKACYH